MKKLILSIALAISTVVALPIAASAAPAPAPYKLPASYQAVYCYTTGSYWQAQRAAYPAYYAANGAYYNGLYGLGTMYCPN